MYGVFSTNVSKLVSTLRMWGSSDHTDLPTAQRHVQATCSSSNSLGERPACVSAVKELCGEPPFWTPLNASEAQVESFWMKIHLDHPPRTYLKCTLKMLDLTMQDAKNSPADVLVYLPLDLWYLNDMALLGYTEQEAFHIPPQNKSEVT